MTLIFEGGNRGLIGELSFWTNRIIGGEAPPLYLAGLERGKGKAPVFAAGTLDGYLSSDLINPNLLRPDEFEAFMADRQRQLFVPYQGSDW